MKNIAVIIVAAGRGLRTGLSTPKQYAPLHGVPLLTHTARRFVGAEQVSSLLCVIGADDLEAYNGCGLPFPFAVGGATRTQSVRSGLEYYRQAAVSPDWVAVHDAARPFMSGALWRRLIKAAEAEPTSGIVPVLPVTDTLRREGVTVPRDNLFAVQTPQLFPFQALCAAYEQSAEDAGDDAAVWLQAGGKIVHVPGERENFKITDAADIAAAERQISVASNSTGNVKVGRLKVGQGVDIHPFDPHKTQLILGGVTIDHVGLKGHSDADVMLHALTDALLSTISTDDIGIRFPPSDMRWRGADSRLFVQSAVDSVYSAGGKIMSLSLNVLCESPRLAPHRAAIINNVAAMCKVNPDCVGLSAGTAEGMGFIGRREGIMCTATVAVSFL